jgi:hypothetical protein
LTEVLRILEESKKTSSSTRSWRTLRMN